MMTEAQTRRLASLSNCFTSYEIAFHGIDGHKVLCGYSQRKTRACIAKMLVAMRDAVLPLIDETDADWNGRAYTSPTWSFGFTGRTERQCIMEGELPPLASRPEC